MLKFNCNTKGVILSIRLFIVCKCRLLGVCEKTFVHLKSRCQKAVHCDCESAKGKEAGNNENQEESDLVKYHIITKEYNNADLQHQERAKSTDFKSNWSEWGAGENQGEQSWQGLGYLAIFAKNEATKVGRNTMREAEQRGYILSMWSVST